MFNVSINGLLQERDIDFFHIAGTSKITFPTPPLEGDIITITYYKGRNSVFIDNYGKPVQVATENFVYNGTTLAFTTMNAIDSVVSLDINGLVEEEGVGFNVSGQAEITLSSAPALNSKIGVTYLY